MNPNFNKVFLDHQLGGNGPKLKPNNIFPVGFKGFQRGEKHPAVLTDEMWEILNCFAFKSADLYNM